MMKSKTKLFLDKTPFFQKDHFLWMCFSKIGRLNRRRYWLCTGIVFLIDIIIEGLLSALNIEIKGFNLSNILILMLFVPIRILIYVAYTMTTIKRLHDVNYSGYILLITFIIYSVVGFFIYETLKTYFEDPKIIFICIFMVIGSLWPGIPIMFFKGTSGDNKYGPNPLNS